MQNQRAKKSISIVLAILLAIIPLVQNGLLPDPNLLPRQFLLLGFATILVGYLAFRQKTSRQIIAPKLLIASISLALLYFLSTFYAFNVAEANYTASKIILYVACLLLLIWTLKTDLLNLKFLLFGISVSAAISLLLLAIEIVAITQKGTQLWDQKNLYELRSAFGHKNLYSSYQLLCLPFILMLFIQSKTSIKIPLVALLFGIILSLVLVQTKAVLLAIALAVGALVILALVSGAIGSNRIKIALVGGFTFALVVLLLAILLLPEKLILLRSNDTVIERYLLWGNSWQMLKEFPIFGVGAGNWQLFFPKYGLGNFMQTNYLISDGFTTFQRPHNDFFWVACETGIIGILFYFFIIGYGLMQCWLGIKNKQSEAWIVGAGFIAYIFVAAVDFPLERNEHQLLFALLFACAYPKNNATQKSIPKWLFALVFVGLGFSLWFGLNRFREEKKCRKMIEAYRNGNYNSMFTHAQDIDQNYLSIDNYSIPINWYQGLALYAAGRKDLSLLANQKAYAVNPYQIHVINNLAGLYHENDSLQHALILYNEVLQISPKQPDAILNKCAVLYNLGQTKMAFETLYLFKYDAQNQQFMQSLLSVGYAFFKESKGIEFNEIQLKQWFLKSKEKEYTFEQSILH